MNIRKELEALRSQLASTTKGDPEYPDSWSRGYLMACGDIADGIDTLLQRIPEGWELRPREPSERMERAALNAEPSFRNLYVAAWDACKENGHE